MTCSLCRVKSSGFRPSWVVLAAARQLAFRRSTCTTRCQVHWVLFKFQGITSGLMRHAQFDTWCMKYRNDILIPLSARLVATSQTMQETLSHRQSAATFSSQDMTLDALPLAFIWGQDRNLRFRFKAVVCPGACTPSAGSLASVRILLAVRSVSGIPAESTGTTKIWALWLESTFPSCMKTLL